jgi:hypothetical protein
MLCWYKLGGSYRSGERFERCVVHSEAAEGGLQSEGPVEHPFQAAARLCTRRPYEWSEVRKDWQKRSDERTGEEKGQETDEKGQQDAFFSEEFLGKELG